MIITPKNKKAEITFATILLIGIIIIGVYFLIGSHNKNNLPNELKVITSEECSSIFLKATSSNTNIPFCSKWSIWTGTWAKCGGEPYGGTTDCNDEYRIITKILSVSNGCEINYYVSSKTDTLCQ